MNRVLRNGCRSVASRRNKMSPCQHDERRLRGALRQSWSFRDPAEPHGHVSLAPGTGSLPQKEIHDERRRLSVMPDEVGHQRADDIPVEGETCHWVRAEGKGML